VWIDEHPRTLTQLQAGTHLHKQHNAFTIQATKNESNLTMDVLKLITHCIESVSEMFVHFLELLPDHLRHACTCGEGPQTNFESHTSHPHNNTVASITSTLRSYHTCSFGFFNGLPVQPCMCFEMGIVLWESNTKKKDERDAIEHIALNSMSTTEIFPSAVRTHIRTRQARRIASWGDAASSASANSFKGLNAICFSERFSFNDGAIADQNESPNGGML
jgi:hypothetical protein